MNKILKEKINKDIINIIQSYTLPLQYKYGELFKELYLKVSIILFRLDKQTCYDSHDKFYNNLSNTKIVKITDEWGHYWTIGKIS